MIKLNTGLDIRTALPVDKRFVLTKNEMLSMNDNLMPSRYFAICVDDSSIYIYDKTAAFTPTTGRFTKLDAAIEAEIADLQDQINNCVKNNDYQTFKTAIESRMTTAEQTILNLETEIVGTGRHLTLSVDQTNYKLTSKLFDKNGNELSTSTVDLPIESLVKSGYYDKVSKEIVLVLENGSEIRIPVGDLVSDLATKAELLVVKNSIPTKVSQLTNDAGYLTEHQSLAAYRSSAAQDVIDATKQTKLIAGANITINEDNVISSATPIQYEAGENIIIAGKKISAVDTKYTAGTNIEIDENNVISATGGSEPLRYLKEASADDTTLIITRKDGSTVTFTPKAATQQYTAGENVQISEDLVISATDTKYNRVSYSADGLMSADDKYKLDNLNNYDDTEVRNLIANKVDLSDFDQHKTNTNMHTTAAEKEIWNAKQAKLTAGTNITIDENNVISATGSGASYTAGENIQISANNVISATDTIYDDTEVRSLINNKQDQISAENKLDYSLIANTPTIPTKVSELENDSEYVTNARLVANYYNSTEVDAELALKQDKISDLADIRSGATLGSTAVQPAAISDMATKAWVESKNYLTEHQDISGKQDKLTAGTNVQIEGTTISATDTIYDDTALAGRVSTIEGKEASWDAKQDKLTAGTNITIANNVISATGGGSLTDALTTNITVGGIPSGTTFPAGTSVEAILRQLLYYEAPTTSNIYKGIVNTIPDDVSGLTAISVERETLLDEGYVYKNITTDNQYAVLAIDKSIGLNCYQIEVSGFAMGFLTKDLGDQYLYYFESPTTESGIRYTYLFEEEE